MLAVVALLLLVHGWAVGALSVQPYEAYQAHPTKRAKASRAAFKTAGGIVYIRDFLTDDEFDEVRGEGRRLRGKAKREKDSIAIGRLGRCVDRRSPTHKLLTSAAISDRLCELLGEEYEASEYPIELRHYPRGAQMEWHRDDLLFSPAQCEVVLTLENDSDSRTEWFDGLGRKEGVWTEPNSIIAVRAGEDGPSHRVTPIQRGERTIIKMVFAPCGGTKTAMYEEHLDSFPGRRVRKKVTSRK